MNHKIIFAPAKINLFLYVLGNMPGGYHEIFTLMLKVSLFDKLTLSVLKGDSVSIETDMPGLPTDSKNTVYKAIEYFFRNKHIEKKQVNVYIEKNIPVEAGMGGGSSDASAVLKTLNEIMHVYSEKELFEISKHIGSDVPFFMVDGPAIATGKGGQIDKVQIKDLIYFIVIKPDFGISTQWAYSHLNLLTNHDVKHKCYHNVYTNKEIAMCLHNDLEIVAEEYNPQIKLTKERLLFYGADGAMMTGSGSAVFGLFFEKKAAENAYLKISKEFTTVYKLTSI